jgi:hypothetical protein
MLAWLGLLAGPGACVFMSNQAQLDRAPDYRGIRRVVVILRHWPCYQQLPGVPEIQREFISGATPFFAPWEAARDLNPRAVDLAGLDDLVSEVVLERLRDRGYDPVLLAAGDLVPDRTPLSLFLARQRLLTPEADAYLLGFYAPTLYISQPERAPAARGWRSYTLEEVARLLTPGRRQVLWAGPVASQAPAASISHAIIHLTMSLFRAADGKVLWQVADSRVAGHPLGIVAHCPPFPSRESYWAGVEVVRRLLRDNLKCRLHYLLPQALPARPSGHQAG